MAGTAPGSPHAISHHCSKKPRPCASARARMSTPQAAEGRPASRGRGLRLLSEALSTALRPLRDLVRDRNSLGELSMILLVGLFAAEIRLLRLEHIEMGSDAYQRWHFA